MASFEINSSNTDIDIQKLKLEIENSNILSAKVISITPSSLGVKVLIDAPVSTSQTQLAALKTSVVDTHNSLQRRRILVYDLPDTTGSASNKDYVDSATQNTLDEAKAYTDTKVAQEIAALVNSAPAVLDTLGELSDALGDDPNFATTVSNRIGTAESRITTLEARPNITSLDAISDVTITSPVANQALQYIDGEWKNNTLAPVALSNSYLDLNNKPSLSELGGQLDDLSDVSITTSTKGQFLVNDGTNFINSNTIESSSSISKPLVIKSATGQTENLFEVQDSSGTALFSIDKDGSVSNGTVPVARVSGLAAVATSGSYNDLSDLPTLSANLDDLLDVSITSVSSDQILKYDGTNWVNAAAPAVGLTTLNGISTETQTLETGTTGSDFNISTTAATHTFNLPDASATARGVVTTGTQTLAGNKTLSGGAQIISPNSTTKSLVVKGAASMTTTNILEVQDSASNVLLAVRSNSSDATDSWTVSRNKVGIGSTDKPATTLNVHNSSGNTILQLTTGSESPAFENGFRIFYDGTTVIQKVCPTNAPLVFYTGGGNTNRVNIAASGLLTANYGAVINSGSESTKGLIIQGAASQTANLIEAQNSSGTNLFSVSSSGSVDAGTWNASTIGIAKGGTGQTTAQLAINALTQVSSATDEHVLTKDTSSGNATWKPITAAVFALPDGSAGSPSLYFTNDTNTGFYRQSSDKLTFVANGQNALVVDGTSGVGRLMVGNGTPVSRIQLADDTLNSTAGITFGTSSASYAQLFRSSGGIVGGAELTTNAHLVVNNTAPTIYFQDTDHTSAMIHVNSNVFYILRGTANNSKSWQNAPYPLYITLADNHAYFGGSTTISGGRVNLTDANQSIYSSSNHIYIQNAENAIIFNVTNGVTRNMTDNNGQFMPAADAAYSLGFYSWDGYRWLNLHLAGSVTNASDQRDKFDIQDSTLGLDFICSLRPVSYKYKVAENIIHKGDELNPDGTNKTICVPREGLRNHYGFLAQQVKQVVSDPDFAGWALGDKTDPESKQALVYTEFIAPMVKAIQQLNQKIESLEARIQELENK